jgi:hypothetical protein
MAVTRQAMRVFLIENSFLVVDPSPATVARPGGT